MRLFPTKKFKVEPPRLICLIHNLHNFCSGNFEGESSDFGDTWEPTALHCTSWRCAGSQGPEIQDSCNNNTPEAQKCMGLHCTQLHHWNILKYSSNKKVKHWNQESTQLNLTSPWRLCLPTRHAKQIQITLAQQSGWGWGGRNEWLVQNHAYCKFKPENYGWNLETITSK